MLSGKRQPKAAAGPDSWETLVDRFDTLASAVSASTAAVAKKDGELVAMRRELETRIGNLETYVTSALQELRSAEAAASTKRESTVPPGSQARDDRKVVLLGEEVSALSAQLQAMATAVQTTSAGVASHERALEVLGKRLEVAGESSRSELDGSRDERLDDLVRATTAALQTLDAQEAEIVTVRTELATSSGALEERVEELRQTIAELVVRAAEDPKKATTRSAKLDLALERRLDDIVESMASAVERLDAQQAEIATIRTTLATPGDELELRVEELRQMVTGLVVHVEDLGRLEEAAGRDSKLDVALERRLDDVVQAMTTASEHLAAQEAEIATMRTALATANEAVEQRVDQLGQTVAGLVVHVEDLGRLEETAGRDSKLDAAYARRLDDVVQAMTTTAEHVDAQEAEIATMRTALATANEAVEQRVDQLGQTVADLIVRGDDLARIEHTMARGAEVDLTLERRLDEVVRAMTSAAEDLDAQEAEIATMRSALATSDGAIEQQVDQLWQTVADLVVRGDDLARLEEELARTADRDGVLEQRLDGIVRAVTGASEQLAAQQAAIAALETSLAVPGEALEPQVEELRQMVAVLATEVHGLAERDGGQSTSNLDERLSEMSGVIDSMGTVIDGVVSRVDRIAASVDDSLAALGDPEVGLAELDRHFTEANARFETIISDVRGLIRVLPTSASQGNDELVAQLDELRANAAAAAERITHLESRPAVGIDNPAAIEHLEDELAALRARLQRSAMPDELVSQLDALRLSTSTVGARIERLEDLTSRTADNASSSASRIGADLAALARRLEQIERREDGLVAEIERAQGLWPVALRSLEARLDDIVAKQDGVGSRDENGGSLVAALHASLAAMQAVAAETPGAVDLTSPEGAQGNGEHTPAAPPRARTRRTKT